MELEDILKNLVKTHSTKNIDLHCISSYNPTEPEPQQQLRESFDFASDIVMIDRSLNCNNTALFLEWGLQSIPKVDQHRFLLVTGDYSYYKQNHPNVVYFPVYFFLLLRNPTLKKHDMLSPRPYPFQCLNINPSPHKTLNIIKLSQRPWFKKSLTSFYWIDPPGNGYTNEGLIRVTMAELTKEEKNILNSFDLPLRIELPNEPDPVGNIYTSNASRCHELAFIDYVPESTVLEPFVSEKIWKPIFSGQLFLTLGPMGLIQHLQDLGIDTFSDIIDHSKYDHVFDTREKIDIILGLLDNLLCSDLEKIWQDTYERRCRNCDLMYDPEFHHKLTQELIDRISR